MKYCLALVEYLNTFPFSEGFKLMSLESKLDIMLVTPAQCAQLFEEGKADISLCPVGALSEMPAHEVRGKYCIGADGEVGTVVLLSQVPLDEITSVRLDDHSRTSNVLLQILAHRLWLKDWEFYFSSEAEVPTTCLMIGDKVFENKNHYPYQYDLATAWKALTGLPIVFAVWITKPGIPHEIIEQLNLAFEKGMESIQNDTSGLAAWQTEYLLHQISYPLDKEKREAMKLYLTWAESIMALPHVR